MISLMNEKQTLRSAVLKRRSALSEDQVQKASEDIVPLVMDYIRSREKNLSNGTVMSYSSFRKEMPTEDLNNAIRDAGFTLILPYTDDQFRIHPLIIDSRTVFRISSLGIREPDIRTCREADPAQIDLILMPGIAFDQRGYRIGFGKGCYDRFLPAVPAGTPVIALAYDFQLIDRVPEESHDRPADGIITPTRTLIINPACR